MALPKNWIVLNDGSKEFEDIVLSFIKEKEDNPFLKNIPDTYYGYNIFRPIVSEEYLERDMYNCEKLSIEDFKRLKDVAE